MLAGVVQLLLLNKDKAEKELESRSSEQILKGLTLALCVAYITYVLGASANISKIALNILSFFLAVGMLYLIVVRNCQVPLVVQFGVALCALNLKIFSTQGNLFILVLLNIVALIFICQKKIEFILAVISIIIFKSLDFGPVGGDLFHSSELVISYQRGLNLDGEWHVFPNIGYLEEVIPNLIVDVLFEFSRGYFQISIQEAYSLCLIFLTGGMYYFLEKKWKGIAYAFSMLMTVERLTLMLVINLTLLISSLRSNLYTWATIGLMPLLMLGLSPAYGAILVFSLSLFFLNSKPSIWLLVPTVLVACLSVAIYGDTFIYFLKIYTDWGAVNSAAHGLVMWDAPIYKTVLRLAFIFSLSVLIWQVIKHNALNLYSCIALLGVGLSLWMYLNYGFTRLDKGTGSRVFPVGMAIFVSLVPYLKQYTKVIPSFLLISSFGASFVTPQPIGEINLARQSPKMTLNLESQRVLDRYKAVAQKLGGEFILFGNHPTLGNFIPNVKVPPFSSPWVAIGQLPQERTISFFDKNPSMAILLGDNFSTWDGVDVRARSPIVYRYISQHYRQELLDGIIVAMPAEAGDEFHFFSGFNIGAGAAYYRQKAKNQVDVVAPCDRGESSDGVYKVINEKNYFYAKLHCGLNSIPDVYFVGKHLNVVRAQGK